MRNPRSGPPFPLDPVVVRLTFGEIVALLVVSQNVTHTGVRKRSWALASRVDGPCDHLWHQASARLVSGLTLSP